MESGGDAATQEPDPPPPDPFKGDPSLRRLNNRWRDLEPWERMTMEERRDTWGYNYTPPVKADPAAGNPATLVGPQAGICGGAALCLVPDTVGQVPDGIAERQ